MESESSNFAIRTYQHLRNVVPMEKRNIFLVYFLILLGTALDNFNSAGGMTLAINIQEAYKTSSVITSWVLSAYALTLGAFIMVTGKLADIFGPHNIYIFGLLIIAIQGLGASALIPSSIALAANYFSGPYEKYLGRSIVVLIVAVTGSMGFGIILGGAFSETSIGYRGFYYFSFAYTFLVDVALLFLMIPITKTEGHQKLSIKQLDWVGAILAVGGLLLMILGLTEGGDTWKSAKAIAPLIAGIFTFIASFVYEIFYLRKFQMKHKDKDPSYDWRLEVQLLFPPELVKIPNFIPFLLVCGFYYATYAMIHVAGIAYFSYIVHDPPIIAALKVFPATLGLMTGAAAYRLSYYSKVGLRNMFILSAFLTLVGTIWFSRINFQVKNSYWKYNCFSLFIYGYGVNMFFNIYMIIVIEKTPLHLQGVVSGVYQTCCQVLLSFGNALVPSIAGSLGFANTLDEKISLHKKLRTLFYVIIALQTVPAVVLTVFLKNPQKGKEEADVVVVATKEEEISSDEISESLKTETIT
ncbi:hypothetical protein CANINC_001368 [Pichia inconspicua]|uniref:Major facilitator superfamily (MFS) profile domain-containing protein n=1 Tax=Pichia inconspicua TaxID=52247 RepID=A0A4T0X552_9ASCO|nr:hypothetical protein CANINC_001368 [[Candida] inconspicua]